jgi:hypothetical protein
MSETAHNGTYVRLIRVFLVQAAILLLAFMFGSLDFGVSAELSLDVGLVLRQDVLRMGC